MKELNKDQLDGIANLSFDLAKVTFGFSVLPTFSEGETPLTMILKVLLGIVTGLAFTYFSLLVLRQKERLNP